MSLPYTIHEQLEQRSEEWHQIRCGRFTASKLGPFLTAEKSIQLEKKDMIQILSEAGIDHNPKAKNEDLEKLLPNPSRYLDYDKTTKSARMSIICEKLGEIAGETKEVWPNDAMKRGTALEPLARKAYMERTGLNVVEVGFVSYNGYPLGFSPDGLIIEDGIIRGGQEIKAPQPSTHIKWLLDGGLPDEHKFQVHASLAMSNAPWWDFFSFCPSVTEWNKKDAREWKVVDWNKGHIPSILIRVFPNEFTAKVKAGLLTLAEELDYARMKIAAIREEELKQVEAA